MPNLSPLIKPSYIQSYEILNTALGNPFEFPLDLDDSGMDAKGEMMLVCDFLKQHTGNKSTLANYTKEMERFLQWLWRVRDKPLLKLTRVDAQDYLVFIQAPPHHWIARGGSMNKFLPNGEANALWRPFTSRHDYEFKASVQSVRAAMNAVSGLYYHLIDCGHTAVNPFMKMKNPVQAPPAGDQLTSVGTLGEDKALMLRNAKAMAADQPGKHDRTVFIVMALAYMDIKVTDLAPNLKAPPPRMNSFRFVDGNWMFEVQRSKLSLFVHVDPNVMASLAIYRKSLSLSVLPDSNDDGFLLRSLRSNDLGYIQSSKQIRKILAQVKVYGHLS